MNGASRSVAFCHLDLGLGGAERFIVDSALELQGLGHKVHVYTSHFDSSRYEQYCCLRFRHALPHPSKVTIRSMLFTALTR